MHFNKKLIFSNEINIIGIDLEYFNFTDMQCNEVIL